VRHLRQRSVNKIFAKPTWERSLGVMKIRLRFVLVCLCSLIGLLAGEQMSSAQATKNASLPGMYASRFPLSCDKGAGPAGMWIEDWGLGTRFSAPIEAARDLIKSWRPDGSSILLLSRGGAVQGFVYATGDESADPQTLAAVAFPIRRVVRFYASEVGGTWDISGVEWCNSFLGPAI
jgi:hypothetical protein